MKYKRNNDSSRILQVTLMFAIQDKVELWNFKSMGSFRDYLALYFYLIDKETQVNRMQNGKTKEIRYLGLMNKNSVPFLI